VYSVRSLHIFSEEIYASFFRVKGYFSPTTVKIIVSWDVIHCSSSFLIRKVRGEVQSGPTRHVGYLWPIVPDCEDGEFGGMKIDWQGKPKYSENLSQRHFVHHKYHLTRHGREPGPPPRWEASD
jgi:hypothetical protein